MHKAGACFFICGGLFLLVLTIADAPAQEDSSQVSVLLVPIAIQEPLAGPFVPGCTEYQVNYGGGSGSQGGYGALNFPSCDQDPCGEGGANRYRCQLMNGYPCWQDSGICVPNKAGNMSGPTMQALAARFNNDTDVREGICYTDYLGNGSRIMTTLITGLLQGGAFTLCYPVLHYGTFFLTRIPGSDGSSNIWATYLGHPGANPPTPAFRPTWGALKTLYR